MTGVPDPPKPFQPLEFTLHAGTDLYRVASNDRRVNEFNPGLGGRTRFAFFGTPTIPVLYGAQTIEAAICESLLHDIPQAGGLLRPRAYRNKVGARLTVGRDLKLASFMGLGLKALKIEQSELIDTPPTTYDRTVAWAQAAYDAGFDGAAWMSRRCNTDRAYVLFGDRVLPSDLPIYPGYGQVYTAGKHLDWLIRFCAPLHVDVLVHS
ncbi:RES domain-containing protein [Arthrobacter wenxiniae]|uniref:RES family NAD+ phosphorylase n=1 Tax=Arthrobacter wenxiniae TaxID=2713570 RepID=A0A7Y7M0V2_9MICC|nr:RES family NAD+ phosphorylase [Arthrobacter wenxiniae]